MYFKEAEIKNFRNYSYCKESFHPEINIFIGENGQGKTSLAEALYVMCLGRSFRTSKDKEMIKFGEEAAVIKTVVWKNERNIKTDLIISHTDKKKVKINGSQKSIRNLSDNINIVSFSPEDLKIVKDDPDKRRRFLNREICQVNISYYEALAGYTKVLSQRNSLLKSEKVSSSLLDVWDEELIKYGSKIIRERNRFIKRLSQISSAIHNDISNGKEVLEIEYDSYISFDEISALEEFFRKKLLENRKIDLIRKTTSTGPHKDDLKISINGIDARKFGSQGQQRTAALSLKLAEIRLMEEESGETPVLILDDVLSELDNNRQHYLIESLKGVQIFLTSTNISPEIADKFKEKYVFEIFEGNITKRLE